jgi:hypothetical protein
MTGEELIAHMRESILDDVAEPYRWKTAELLRYLNYAEVQACRRAHLIIDGTTANDNGTAATAGTFGRKPLCSLTIVAGQAVYSLSPKILQVKRCQFKSMTYPIPGPVSYPELDDTMSGWIGTSGTIDGNNDGVKAKGSIISNGVNVTAADTVTIGTNGYAFVTTTPAVENEVARGTSGRDSLSKLKGAINSGGTSATCFCSGPHPSITASMTSLPGDSGTLGLEAILNGILGNDIVLATTAVTLAVSGSYMTGGIDNSGFPTYFLNEPGNTITFVRAPSSVTTAYLVVSRLPLTPFTLQTSPEIEEKYHEGLMNWATHLAYMKGDSETLNLNLAKMYEDMFVRQFGQIVDAYSERMRKVISQRQRMRPREFGS